MKTAKVNAYVRYIFWKIELLSTCNLKLLKLHYFNDFQEAKTYLYIGHWKYGRNMTFMDFWRFVLAPADKAANNVVVAWKRYYINTLKQELSTEKTYEHNRLDETSIVDRHRYHMAAKFELFVDEDHSTLPTLYWLPKLHKRPYKSRFIANSSACTTTELDILLTSCLTAIKNQTMSLNIAQQFMKEMVKILLVN